MVEDSVLKGNPLYDLLARDGRRKLKGDLDVDNHALLNLILENLASDPSNPIAGRLWYNSVDGLARYWDGTKIRTLLGNFQLAGGTPTPETVGESGSFGVSSDGIPIDHVHAGVRSLCKKLSTQLMGNVKLVAGTNITLNQTDVDKEIEIVASGSAGDMTKAVYDTDDDGIVDNSELLEGSNKAAVQDHNTTLAKVTDHDAKETTPHVSAAEKTAWNAKLDDLVDDLTPQLGGNLDAQDKLIQKVDSLGTKEIAAPGTPAGGYGVVYEKTDGKLYFKNDAGVETELTAGGGGGATSGTVILLNANETQANGTIGMASNDVAMKTYALGINTYSRIIVEFDGYIVFGANSQIQLGVRGEIGANLGPYQKVAQDATGSGDYFWIPFSVKYSIQQQAAVTITARIHWYLGADSTYYINNLRVYGVVA